MRMEDRPTECLHLSCTDPRMISMPLSNLSADWKLSESLMMCRRILKQSFCQGESTEFRFLAGFCVKNAKSHVQWSEVQLTIELQQDAIHAKNDWNENLV